MARDGVWVTIGRAHKSGYYGSTDIFGKRAARAKPATCRQIDRTWRISGDWRLLSPFRRVRAEAGVQQRARVGVTRRAEDFVGRPNFYHLSEVHDQQRNLAAMSQHCLSCHKVEQLEQSATHAKLGEALTKNCIDCHMPMLESKAVYINVDGKKVHPRLRTHWIKIYSDQERQ